MQSEKSKQKVLQKKYKRFEKNLEYREVFEKMEEYPMENKIIEKYSKILNKKIIIFYFSDFFEKWGEFLGQFETECMWICCGLNAFYFLENHNNENDELAQDLENFLQKIKENAEITHIWFYDDYLERSEAIEFLSKLKSDFEKL